MKTSSLALATFLFFGTALAACGDDTGGGGGAGGGGTGGAATTSSTGEGTTTTTTSASSGQGGGTTSASVSASSSSGQGGSTTSTGSGSSSSSDASTGSGGGLPSSVEVVDCADGFDVTIGTLGLAFDPPEATIAAGATLRFAPGGFHDMTADDLTWNTPNPGDTACLKFNDAGLFPFHCSVHPGSMTGTITVE